jgi:hypothetical protein
MRRTVPAGVLAWQKAQKGIGEHLLARLLGTIGNPRWREPHHWEGTGSNRILIADEPGPRSISQLWAYCGAGNPLLVPIAGDAVRQAALGNPVAKSLSWNIATACLKAGVRNEGDDKVAISDYGDLYLRARKEYAEREHAIDCKRCGPSGKPALAGSPWSKAHQFGAALRKMRKEILRDLWIAAGDG